MGVGRGGGCERRERRRRDEALSHEGGENKRCAFVPPRARICRPRSMTSEPSARRRRRKRCAGPGQAPGGRSPGLVGTASGAYREDVVIVVAELLLGEEFQVLPLRVEAQGGLHRDRGPSRGGGDERLVTRERRARMSRAPDASAGGFAGEGAGTRAGGRARAVRGEGLAERRRGGRGDARAAVWRASASASGKPKAGRPTKLPARSRRGESQDRRANGQSTVRRFRSRLRTTVALAPVVPWGIADCARSRRNRLAARPRATSRRAFPVSLPGSLPTPGRRVSRGHPSPLGMLSRQEAAELMLRSSLRSSSGPHDAARAFARVPGRALPRGHGGEPARGRGRARRVRDRGGGGGARDARGGVRARGRDAPEARGASARGARARTRGRAPRRARAVTLRRVPLARVRAAAPPFPLRAARAARGGVGAPVAARRRASSASAAPPPPARRRRLHRVRVRVPAARARADGARERQSRARARARRAGPRRGHRAEPRDAPHARGREPSRAAQGAEGEGRRAATAAGPPRSPPPRT